MKGLISLICLTILFSCQEPGKKETAQGQTIYYYPSANVYFDADNNHYLFLNGTEGWEKQKELPQDQSALGSKVLVENPTVPVWKANGDHKMIYAASLYTAKTDYHQKFIEDSLKAIPRKSAPIASIAKKETDSLDVKKNKSGVGKFIDRLFGGKDRKKKKGEERPEENDS